MFSPGFAKFSKIPFLWNNFQKLLQYIARLTFNLEKRLAVWELFLVPLIVFTIHYSLGWSKSDNNTSTGADRFCDINVSHTLTLHQASLSGQKQTIREEWVATLLCKRLYGEKYIYIAYISCMYFWYPPKLIFSLTWKPQLNVRVSQIKRELRIIKKVKKTWSASN